MSALLVMGLKNAILVIPLALVALAVARYSRRPALAHLMWTVVLLKMLTPPLIHVPVGWKLDVESWLQTDRGSQTDRSPKTAVASGTSRAAKPNQVQTVAGKARSRLGSKAPIPRTAPQGDQSTSRPVVAASPPLWSLLSWRTAWAWKLELLGSVWLIGSLWIIFKLVVRSRQFHCYLQLAEKRHEWLRIRPAELAAQSGISIAPRVIVVEGCLSPMLWGMGRRACLVFPAKLISRLSPTELDSLLLHELAHFARGDHWVRVLELAVGVLYWWHPVFWWARNELETAEEQCCDAWVVEHQNGSRHAYAEALLATIEFLHEPATLLPPVACGLGEVPFLRIRLTQIMRGDVMPRLPSTVSATILIGGLLCSPLEPALWARPADARSISATNKLDDARDRATRIIETNRVGSNDLQSTSETNHADAPPKRNGTKLIASNVSKPNRIGTFDPSRPTGLAWATARSPNGKYNIEARLGRRTTLTYSPPEFRLDLTAHQITCLTFASDSRTFITGHEDAIVRRWDSETGGVLQSFKGCDSPITSIHMSPDGTRLVAGTHSGSVVVWDMASGDEVSHVEFGVAVSCVRVSNRGDRFAITLGDWSDREHSRLIVRSLMEDAVLQEQSLEQPVGAMDWVGPDNALVLAAWNGHARIWNSNAGRMVSELRLDKDRISAAAWSSDCSLFGEVTDIDSLLSLE